MAAIDLIFKYDDLKLEGEFFKAHFPEDVCRDALEGLIGPSGYWIDTPFEVSGHIYRSVNGEVILDGHLSGSARFLCVRCSQAQELEIKAREDFVIVPKGHPAAEEADISGEGDLDLSPDIYVFKGHEVDLTPIFREAIILQMPLHPKCEMLQKVCLSKNQVTYETSSSNIQAKDLSIDPRWAPLLAMREVLKKEKPAQLDPEEAQKDQNQNQTNRSPDE